jgi:hypothetical protein
VRLESSKEKVYPRQQSVVDAALELEGRDAVLSLGAVAVDLGLLCADEGLLVDVGVDFDVRVVGELDCVLRRASEHVGVVLEPDDIPICCSRPASCRMGL